MHNDGETSKVLAVFTDTSNLTKFNKDLEIKSQKSDNKIFEATNL